MSVSNVIPYGEALGKAIWNYFGLTDYVKAKFSSGIHGKIEYSDVSELWKDALKGSTNDDGELKLKRGRIVKLSDFSFTEWFPWLPGMYWTPYGMSLRERGYQERANNLRDQLFQDKRMLSPDGKTLTVLSGIGAVRMDILRPSVLNQPIKVLGATTRTQHGITNASSGVIMVMTKNAYEKISRIQEQGVLRATVEGIYTEVPAVLDDVFRSTVNVPRFCIYVGSQLNVTDIHEGDNVTTAGWTVYERQQENQQTEDYDLAFCNFNAANVQGGPEEAAFFLTHYLDEFNGMALTDFDGKITRLQAAYPITTITRGDIDIRKFRELVKRIRRKYPYDTNLNSLGFG